MPETVQFQSVDQHFITAPVTHTLTVISRSGLLV